MLTNGASSRAAGLTMASRRAARTSQLSTPSTVALLRSRHRQYRAFWFGAWARDGGEDAWHHARRRHRAHKHRCIELPNCKLSWENKPRRQHVRAVMKTAFAHIANGPTSTQASKYININYVKSWSDELSSGLRPGRNIEDVEREAIDHLFSTHKQNNTHQAAHWSPLSSIRKYLIGDNSGQVTADEVVRETTSSEDTIFARSSASSHFTPEAPETEKYSSDKPDKPNATRQLTPEDASKNYNDLSKYKPVEWNEPDGLPESTPEEKSKEYKDLDKYASPNTSNDVGAVGSSEPTYNDLQKYRPVQWNEPDGLHEQTPEELSKNYDDLHKYGSVTWNEPDGLRTSTPEELSKNYDDLGKYGPVQWNEPDGLQNPTPEELSKQYDDLNAYRKPFGASDALLEAHEAAQQQDSTPRAEPIAAKVDASAADAARDYNDLDEYGPVRWNEPDGLQKPTPEELSKNYRDLSKYQPHSFESPDKKYPMHPEEASKAYDDLGSYKPVTHNEPDGKPVEKSDSVASSLGAFDSCHENNTEPPHQTAAEIRRDVLQRAFRNSKSTRQEPGHDSSGEGADSASSGPALTGDYARDFPEEFATSWDTSNSRSKSTLFPKNLAETQHSRLTNTHGGENEGADLSSMDESFPSEKTNEVSTLQPALDRSSGKKPLLSAMNRLESMQLQDDPYSKSPQGLEISYMDECAGHATWPTFVRHHKGRQEEERSGGMSGVGSTSEQQPVLYKMLAYDPSSQSIVVAETCSGVHDTWPPASPAEVLPRVSSPSKFFPYFSALQAEGYEIASGGGDVLVFRKVRPGTASKDGSGSTTINPIDMMGRSGASNFASPTGYVNYESAQYRPVHAGQSQDMKAGKKRRSFGRKVVIGTAWVAGMAFVVSVASEYLSTGGGKVF